MIKINYEKRWDNVKSSLGERDAFVAALPGNTRYLANSESPPGTPPSSTMNYVVIPKKANLSRLLHLLKSTGVGMSPL